MFSVYSGVGMDEKKTSEATAGAASAASTKTKTTMAAKPDENKLNTPSVVPGVPNESENALATYLGLDHLISFHRRTVYEHTTVHDKIPTLWVFHSITAILPLHRGLFCQFTFRWIY